MFWTKVVEKFKTHILCSVTFFFENRALYVEKYGGAWGTTSDVKILRIRVAYWISKATCTHAHPHAQTRALKYVIFIAIPQQQWFANAPRYYVIRRLSVLLHFLRLVYMFNIKCARKHCPSALICDMLLHFYLPIIPCHIDKLDIRTVCLKTL
jgi:hypothetical protein